MINSLPPTPCTFSTITDKYFSVKKSPQICGKSHKNGRRSPSSCLLQLRLEHQTMFLAGRWGGSRLVLQGEGSVQKHSWQPQYPQQRCTPEKFDTLYYGSVHSIKDFWNYKKSKARILIKSDQSLINLQMARWNAVQSVREFFSRQIFVQNVELMDEKHECHDW